MNCYFLLAIRARFARRTRLARSAPLHVAVAALVLAGCEGTPGPAVPAGPPPQETVAEIRQILSPLVEVLNAPPENNGNFTLMDAGVCQGMVEQAAQAAKKHSDSESGRAALAAVAGELLEMIGRARDEDRWGALLCALDVHEQLHPGMLLMRRLRERALLHAQRPHVVVKGFFDDNDHSVLYVFIQVKLPGGYSGARPAEGGTHNADEVHVVQVRVKEEFYGLRLVDVLGNKRGVILEYLADPGHFFQVLAPPRRFTPIRQGLPK